MLRLAALATLATGLVALPTLAHAWTIGSQLDYSGCHERITTEAFRATRAKFATAPLIPPTTDESALIDAVQFVPPADFVHDLAAMSLLLGVRDNDLKGNNALDSLQLVQVHGNPATQEEHCIRSASDDGTPGDAQALVRCKSFIHERIAQALEGLAADGTVDPNNRLELAVYVSFAGRIHPMLPLTYVRLGQAAHALEDSFTHTFRSSDGIEVVSVSNWIDYVSNAGANEAVDGPPHLSALDQCSSADPLVVRNFKNATTAATALMEITLDPTMTNDAKLAAVDALSAQWLTYQKGCTLANKYCDAHEPNVVDNSACNASGASSGWLLVVAGALLVMLRRRRTLSACLALAGGIAGAQPAPPAADAAAPPTASAAPALPAPADKPADAAAVKQGHEPGRDEKTPTVSEVERVREDKRLGSPFGVDMRLGGAFVHGGVAGAFGLRYRLNERWSIGIDGEWNPWITSAPWTLKAGVADVYATVIHRYPMKLDRVNLRTTLNLGASMLLFDVYGAPKYDIGPVIGFSPLGIDYDLGNHVRIVFDPLGVIIPVPHIGLLPLYYEQFRTMIGIQIGG